VCTIAKDQEGVVVLWREDEGEHRSWGLAQTVGREVCSAYLNQDQFSAKEGNSWGWEWPYLHVYTKTFIAPCSSHVQHQHLEGCSSTDGPAVE
jgi:hypothetical protein